jgi:putative membrane protein
MMRRSAVTRLGLMAALTAVALLPAAAHAAAPSEQDTQYLRTIHQVNLAAIQIGQLAQDKTAADQGVQDLGGRMVTDHTQLDEEVTRVAGEVDVTLPDSPTDAQRDVISQLDGLDGNEFDTAFVESQLLGYAQAIEANNAEIAQGSDERVVSLAEEAGPVLNDLYAALQELAAQLGLPTSPSPGVSPTVSPTAPGTETPGPTVSPTLPAPTVSPQTPLPAQT